MASSGRVRVLHGRDTESWYDIVSGKLTGPAKIGRVRRVEFYRPTELEPYMAADSIPGTRSSPRDSTVELIGSRLQFELYMVCWPTLDPKHPLSDSEPPVLKIRAGMPTDDSGELTFEFPGIPAGTLASVAADPDSSTNPRPTGGPKALKTLHWDHKPSLKSPVGPVKINFPNARDAYCALRLYGTGHAAHRRYGWYWTANVRGVELPTPLGTVKVPDIESSWVQWIQPVEAVTEPARPAYAPDQQLWLMRIGSIRPENYARIWNELVLQPYHSALQLVNGASDLSFAPEVVVGPTKSALTFVLDPKALKGDPAKASFPVQQVRTWLDEAPIPLSTRLAGVGHRDGPGRTLLLELEATENSTVAESVSPFSLAAPLFTERLQINRAYASIGARPYWTRIGSLDLAIGSSAVPSGVLQFQARISGFRVGLHGADPELERPPLLEDLTLSIDDLPVADATGGAEDPLPDELRSGHAEPESGPFHVRALVFEVGTSPQRPTGVLLEVRESIARNRARAMTLRLSRPATAARTGGTRRRLTYIGREPFLIAQVVVPPLDEIAGDYDEIGNWSLSEQEGRRWELASAGEGFSLVLPPQAVGEAMEKNSTQSHIEENEPIDYRLGMAARARLRSSYFRQRSSEAPWNLRRVLGFPGQRAPGAPVDELDFELLYGLACRIDGEQAGMRLHLAELGARMGALSGTIDASMERRRGYPRDDLRRDIFVAYRDRWDLLLRAYRSRLAVLELYTPGELVAPAGRDAAAATGNLILDRGVSFDLRTSARLAYPIAPERRSPWDSGSDPNRFGTPTTKPHGDGGASYLDGLEGGVAWPFESDAVYQSLWRDSKSTSGRVAGLFLTSLGGYGDQRACFDNNRTIITSRTNMGRLNRMTVERIGRIGALWHRAKHVIVYERTTLASDQFHDQQAPLKGRAILRKTEEYVELLQPMRDYPDLGGTRLGRGCVERVQFISTRIPVDGQWGRDIADGFEIPLWKSTADQVRYPRPVVRVVTAGDRQGRVDQAGADMIAPQRLFFYSSTDPELDDRTDLWPAVAAVDFADAPPPRPEMDDAFDPNDPDGMMPPSDEDLPGFERFTWLLDDPAQPSNIMAERTEAPLSARLFSVSMMRGEPVAQQSSVGVGLESLLDTRADLDRLRKNMLAAVGGATTLDEAARNRLRRELSTVDRLRGKLADKLEAAADFAERVRTQAQGFDPCTKATEEIRRHLAGSLAAKRATLAEWLERVVQDLARNAGPTIPLPIAHDLVRTWSIQLDALMRPVRTGLEDVAEAIGTAHDQIVRGRSELLRAFDEVTLPIAEGALTPLQAQELLNELLVRLASGVSQWRDRLGRQVPERARPVFENLERDLQKWVEKLRREFPTVPPGDDWKEGIDEAIAVARDALFGIESDGLESVIGILASAKNTVATAIDSIAPETEVSPATILGERVISAITGDWTADAIAMQVRIASALLDDELSTFEKKIEGELEKATALLCKNGPLSWNDWNHWGQEFETAIRDLLNVDDNELKKAVNNLLAQPDVTVAEAIGALHQAWAPLSNGAALFENRARTALKDLGQAPSFREPGSTLRMIRAVGEGPLLPEMKFNRERMAYFFDDYAAAVRTTPVAALVNRAGADLKAFGLRIPTRSLLDHVVPDALENFDLSAVLPDFAALRNSSFFRNIHLPAIANDNVRVRHGIDKANQVAWLSADIGFELGQDAELFSAGPLTLELRNARFDAHSNVTATTNGGVQKNAEGAIIADWQLKVGGASIVTFARTQLRFTSSGRIDFAIRADQIQMSQAMRWLGDLVRTFSDPSKGFTIELVETDGRPTGVRCGLDLPLPPLASGAFAISGLALGASLSLAVEPLSRAFAIGLGFNLGRKVEPFSLTICFLGGGGWVESSALYIPDSGTLVTDLSVGIVAGAGLDINLGPIRGSAYLQFGIFIEVHKSGLGGSHASIGIMLLLRGQVVILGIATVSLSLLLQAVYSQGGLVCSGTLSITLRISSFFKVTVCRQVRYVLAGGSNATMHAESEPSALAQSSLDAAKRRSSLME